MYESEIEDYLIDYAESKGCVVEKLVLLSGRGWTDRTIITPHGVTGYAELKRPKKNRISPQQKIQRAKIKKQSAPYALIDSKLDAEKFVNRLLKMRIKNDR